VWLDGQTTDLGVVLDGAIGADARGISRNGKLVCGFSRFGTGTQWSAFVHREGGGEKLGVLPIPGHDRSIAYAVNDNGIVVGLSSNSNLVGKAFVWRNGVMKALNDMIPPGLNLNIDRAAGINNAGQIAASGRLLDGSNDQVAVRLTPFQPPPGDCDCNGHVGIHDLLNAINQWGPAIPTTTADFDNSGVVDIHDILAVIANWD
jgi:probable HAF family extracellular repeat protein